MTDGDDDDDGGDDLSPRLDIRHPVPRIMQEGGVRVQPQTRKLAMGACSACSVEIGVWLGRNRKCIVRREPHPDKWTSSLHCKWNKEEKARAL